MAKGLSSGAKKIFSTLLELKLLTLWLVLRLLTPKLQVHIDLQKKKIYELAYIANLTRNWLFVNWTSFADYTKSP